MKQNVIKREDILEICVDGASHIFYESVSALLFKKSN